jgi:peptide/nickel transport system permease protein
VSRYIIRRLVQAVPLLFIISLILFVLMQQMGDPLATLGGRQQIRAEDRERLTRQLGLDKPVVVQYIYWLVGNDWAKADMDGDGIAETPGTRRGVLRGDWGTSFITRRPVMDMILERLANTLILMVTYEIIVIVASIAIGVVSALKRYSLLDNLFTTFSFVGYSMPVFWLALMLMYMFAVNFRKWGLPYFPTVGMYDPGQEGNLAQLAWHMVLPVTTLSTITIAAYSRYVRANMLEVIQQDYIRTAQAKGLAPRTITLVHALKNAALPLVTIVGMDLPLLLAGAVVTERIYAWPGMGQLFLDHTLKSDFPVLMGIMMLISIAVVAFQILTDITYTFLDPRIRYE